MSISKSFVRSMAIAVLAAFQAGCFIASPTACNAPEELEAIQDTPPIVVPEGLDPLDEQRALQIPTATTPPPTDPDRCLDRPPRYGEGG